MTLSASRLAHGIGDLCRSKVVYNKQVLPILHAAGLQVTTIFTERPGHAADIVREADLEAVDMFVVCGGDGTIHELLQVLWTDANAWPQWKKPRLLVSLPFAHDRLRRFHRSLEQMCSSHRPTFTQWQGFIRMLARQPLHCAQASITDIHP